MSVMRSVVLPAYNEEAYIEEMVSRCVKAMERSSDPFEIIVVDNCSVDSTASIVDRIHERDPRVRVVRHEVNRLYAGSCHTGTNESTGERIFILDSDGQIDPEEIWKFDAALAEGNDIVFGRRVDRGDSKQRLLVSKVFWLHARLLIDFRLHDVNTGIRGMNRAFADRLQMKHRVNLANPEMYVQARLGGFRIGEVNISQHERQAGVSSHQFTRLWTIEKTVVAHLLDLRKDMKAARRSSGPSASRGRQPQAQRSV
jgi:glycosyltransferase involved in cell wall biosynthesis